MNAGDDLKEVPIVGSGPRSRIFWQHPWIDPFGIRNKLHFVKAEFTAVVESASEGGLWAVCQEIPGANGQGETVEEAKLSLKAAVELIFEDRHADARRELAQNSIKSIMPIG